MKRKDSILKELQTNQLILTKLSRKLEKEPPNSSSLYQIKDYYVEISKTLEKLHKELEKEEKKERNFFNLLYYALKP